MTDDTFLAGHTFYPRINVGEVKKALAQIKIGKAIGPDAILREA